MRLTFCSFSSALRLSLRWDSDSPSSSWSKAHQAQTTDVQRGATVIHRQAFAHLYPFPVDLFSTGHLVYCGQGITVLQQRASHQDQALLDLQWVCQSLHPPLSETKCPVGTGPRL